MNPKRIKPADIAAAMKMTEPECWKFARTMDKRFQPTREDDVGGKIRQIDAPFPYTKKKLRLLHNYLQGIRCAHPIAHGGVRGRSCFTHARKHLHKKFVWTRDAKNCFPSVRTDHFLRQLKKLGVRSDTAQLLAMLCTLRGRIPQGSPVSNDALNIYLWSFDQHNAASAGRNSLNVGRFADDIVVTGNNKSVGDNFVRQMEHRLADLGIDINDKKRRQCGLQNKSAPQLVHNIRVDHPKGTAVSIAHRSATIDVANRYLEGCRRLQPASLVRLAKQRKQLTGYMYYCRQANISPAKHARRCLQAGDRIVAQTFRELGITIRRNKWWVTTTKQNEPARLARIWMIRKQHALS